VSCVLGFNGKRDIHIGERVVRIRLKVRVRVRVREGEVKEKNSFTLTLTLTLSFFQVLILGAPLVYQYVPLLMGKSLIVATMRRKETMGMLSSLSMNSFYQGAIGESFMLYMGERVDL
jgi:hypothetical protein